MNIPDARKLKDHDYVTDGERYYHVRIHHNDKNDLWLWSCKIGSKELITRGGGEAARIYLGSRKTSPDNIAFLWTLSAA